jgi:predicted nucleic acid-binding Zn ribbon protein
MAVAPESQRRRLPGLELLQSAAPAPAEPLKTCLGALQREWRKDDHLAALWQDWPRVAGAQLAPHCRPLSLQRGVLTVGASHPQWRQALLYNKPQLISSLHQAGHAVRDLRIQQHHSLQSTVLESEASIWAKHPSRTDVHGMGTCPDCGRPAPNGEIKLWGHCGFCHRQTLSPS